MCPFCIGAMAWAAAGAVSAGGLGVLAAVVQRRGGPASAKDATGRGDQGASADPTGSA